MTTGHIHGRFQPFHEGHLEYAKWAAAHSDRLMIGVTNADQDHVTKEEADPKRHHPRHNPLEYYERQRIVEAAVRESEIDVPVQVSPFPINRPELWEHYAPPDVTHFVYVLEEWHEVKVDRIRDRDRAVETREKERDISATEVRRTIAEDGSWRQYLPQGVPEMLEELGAVSRIRELWLETNRVPQKP